MQTLFIGSHSCPQRPFLRKREHRAPRRCQIGFSETTKQVEIGSIPKALFAYGTDCAIFWLNRGLSSHRSIKIRLPDHIIDEGFGIDAARELCRIPGMFEVGATYKRNAITSKLVSAYIERGGSPATSKSRVASVFKSWARTDRPFESIASHGRYRFLGYGEQSSEPVMPLVDGVRGDGALSPEREFGNGPHEVYAWCLPRYQVGSSNRYPIKIGRAGADGLTRRLEDFWQNLPERPHYLIRIGCADEAQARERERILHHIFKSRGQQIEHLPGTEWFDASIEEIIEAVQLIVPE